MSSDNGHQEHKHSENQCAFCTIASGRDATSLLHVDQSIVAFNDIKPAANNHILIVPKKHIASINNLKSHDLETVKKMKEVGLQLISGRLCKTVDELSKSNNRKERAYLMGFTSPPFNSINHIHMHVLSTPITTWWPKSLGFGKFIFRNVDDIIAKIESQQE
ncbi:18534_t:CDS:2 [Funneliformis geosporum]|uniref:10031_t:CDS:1 n=1 Tax=Funneliformis geosporum TaxID=1117311 RepID=A0A9W4SPT5_9GLOM|nr:10031_t:CDS:2 [Funneliformis geosporum]CAI2187076.1 18534_t:CDS:2 [Funneliformis geosporum]